jgi:hypothetical protein
MIAYAPEAMSFLDRLRNLIAGPPRVQSGGAEESASLREEFGPSGDDPADVRRVVDSPGGGGGLNTVGYGAIEAAETAEGDLSTEEAPSDPTP